MDNMELWYRLNEERQTSGAPPITFRSCGEAITSWSITGAAGGVGERTRNLLPMSSAIFSDVTVDHEHGSYILSTKGKESAMERVLFGSWTKSSAYVMPFGAGTYTYSLAITAINGGRTCDAIVRRSEHGTGNWQMLTNGQHVTINADDRWLILFYMSPAAGQVYNCRVTLQFEEGSTAHTVEPYGYKIPVTCSLVGGNLFDAASVTNDAGVSGINGEVIEEAGSAVSELIKAGENMSVSFYYSNKTNVEVHCYDTDKHYMGMAGIYMPQKKSERVSHTLNLETGARYVRVVYEPAYVSEIMLNKGTQPQPYRAYTAPVTTDIYIGSSPLGAGEGIIAADAGVDIATLSGVNELTVETAVQPTELSVSSGGIKRAADPFFRHKFDIRGGRCG